MDFSTLNENNIPDAKLLNDLSEYPLKLNEDLVRMVLNESGVNTSDSHVYKLIALNSQKFIEDIINGTAQAIMSKKNNNKFFDNKELTEILKEKGVQVSKTSFYCDNLNIDLDKPYFK